MLIQQGDIIEMKGGTGYEVIEGETDSLVHGELTLIRIDDDNNRIGEPFEYQVTASSPIMDILR
jgi:hypothetical protein